VSNGPMMASHQRGVAGRLSAAGMRDAMVSIDPSW
jgi:hypothetical protein